MTVILFKTERFSIERFYASSDFYHFVFAQLEATFEQVFGCCFVVDVLLSCGCGYDYGCRVVFWLRCSPWYGRVWLTHALVGPQWVGSKQRGINHRRRTV